jgi:hypothetical protein
LKGSDAVLMPRGVATVEAARLGPFIDSHITPADVQWGKHRELVTYTSRAADVQWGKHRELVT